ncbi:unnamed protein product [Knipowitschia caucasica]|uniref:L1 transposable element RRM domain-containing protein n=1 Tax=Knipowitschia caucasica TaxID=637954 RepID=A0AAV2IQ02_KNICA
MPPKKGAWPKKPSEEAVEDEHERLVELSASATTDTAMVLAAIQEMSRKMDDRFNSLDAAMKACQAVLDEHETRLSAVENMATDHDGRLDAVEQLAKRLDVANRALQDKVIDLEARSRRQNIKIVGLAENVEAGQAADFVSNLMPALFGREHFVKPVEVDRALRLGSLRAGVSGRPRVMIARLHSYCTKERIMRLAMEKSPLVYQGQRIHIFPDIPPEIWKRRQLFEDTRKKLKAAGLRTGYIFPSRLRVTNGGVTSTFDTPEEAKLYADNLVPRVDC